MSNTSYYIGLMSGTSADAIDAVLVDLSQQPKLLAQHSLKLSTDLRTRIHALCLPGDNEIERMGALDVELGELFAQATQELLASTAMSPQNIIAIGSHGQTIRHRPPGTSLDTQRHFSLQIGDPNVIAQQTGITTVADFRRRDMAAGGQGAPLVPAFHRAIFAQPQVNRVIVNIGGMANITWLPKEGMALGFDTGPGNVLMDSWIQTHLGLGYDKQGDWAKSGNSDSALVKTMLQHPFFAQQAPKSTGREAFNAEWLHENLMLLERSLAPADVQASLLELSAQSIAQAINDLSTEPKEVLVCGGGAYNQALMLRLEQCLNRATLASTASLGIAPEWIEAMAFAWLAQQTLALLATI